jgi:alanine racemase
VIPSSRIELSRKALAGNIRFLRCRIGKDTLFSSVIKGNAYGHNIKDFVPLAESCGVRHFSVFSIEEAVDAHEAMSEDCHLMIMGYIDNADLEWAITRGVSFYVFDLGRLQGALGTARKLGIPARVHLEVETGLNRTGLDRCDLGKAMDAFRTNPESLRLEGVCTHYAGAESIGNFWRITNQIRTFKDILCELEAEGEDIPVRHSACSAAALRYPETIMDMVRIGIAQYGYWPSKETRIQYFTEVSQGGRPPGRSPLRAVLTWKSRIMGVKSVRAGEYIGYGTIYQTDRPQRIATVPVGYSQGFARSLSNLGHVLVRGKRARILGFVSMSVIIIDISHIRDAVEGDEVVIIGKQGRNEITVSSFSELSRNLNYEVLVRIPSEIERVIVD